jgi:3-oxoadipate enol-lactonase
MPDVAVHHTVDGPEGAPVVLLGNSLGTTVRMWDPQVPALAERFRVVRYDHRGHGGSPVVLGPYTIADLGGDVLALLDREGLGKVSYCGLSLGGMVGIWLAANAPERVDRLILCCTSAYLPPVAGWAERAATVRAKGTEAIVERIRERWFTEAFRASDPEVVAATLDELTTIDAEGYASCSEAIGGMDLRPSLPSVRAPALVIAGGDDVATPPEHAEAIAAAIPGARLEVLPGTAHLANLERSSEVTRLILDHLSRAAVDHGGASDGRGGAP